LPGLRHGGDFGRLCAGGERFEFVVRVGGEFVCGHIAGLGVVGDVFVHPGRRAVDGRRRRLAVRGRRCNGQRGSGRPGRRRLGLCGRFRRQVFPWRRVGGLRGGRLRRTRRNVGRRGIRRLRPRASAVRVGGSPGGGAGRLGRVSGIGRGRGGGGGLRGGCRGSRDRRGRRRRAGRLRGRGACGNRRRRPGLGDRACLPAERK